MFFAEQVATNESVSIAIVKTTGIAVYVIEHVPMCSRVLLTSSLIAASMYSFRTQATSQTTSVQSSKILRSLEVL